ncbi:MAG: DUF615 domain-containing protein [Desulfobulbaceae bacterium]|nr:DUF615 domain-containing protein [Desulfobulbaceae bacterium]
MSVQLSRSEQKRRIKELEKLVVKLVTFPVGVLRQAPCTKEVQELLSQAQSLKGGARKRQIKYITKVLKNLPSEELYAFLSKRQGASLQEKKQLHELEYLRDALVNEAIEQRQRCREKHECWEEDWPSNIVPEIKNRFPLVDEQALKRLAYLFSLNRNNKHNREIFRLLRSALEQTGFQQDSD